MWESHSDKNRQLPAVTDNSRRYLIVTGETPGIEPMVPIAMVRTAPLEEPTILEVLAIGVSTEDLGSDCELWGGVPGDYWTSVG